jgi:hypothetical protein
MAICAQMELPLAWTVRAANEPEQGEVPGLLDSVMERGFAAQVAVQGGCKVSCSLSGSGG